MAHFTPVAPRHTIADLRTWMKQSHDEGQKTRLKAVIFAQEGLGRNEIVKRLQVSDHSVTNWVQAYNERGVSALATNKGGRPKGNPKWSEVPFDALVHEIDKGGYWSVPRMMEWLKERYNLLIPEQTIWYRMDKRGYSYKSARPHPVKGDKERQDTFKKGASPRSWSR